MGRLLTVTDSTQMQMQSPADLSGLVEWHDAASLSSTLSDGNAVGAWPDLSGNARHLTQATTGAQPTFWTGQQHGRPVVVFAGAHNLATPTFAALSQPWSFFLVCTAQSNPSPDQDVISSGPTRDLFYVAARSFGNWSVYTGQNSASAYPVFSNGASDATTKVIVGVVQGGAPGDGLLTRLRVNSADKVTDGMGATGQPTQFVVGGTTGHYLTGAVMEFGVYNRVLTVDECGRLERWLS